MAAFLLPDGPCFKRCTGGGASGKLHLDDAGFVAFQSSEVPLPTLAKALGVALPPALRRSKRTVSFKSKRIQVLQLREVLAIVIRLAGAGTADFKLTLAGPS